MVLSLVDPTGSNFIKDWPAQNAINCDRIDAYANSCLITHPLKTYTPIFRGTTNPSIGTGGSATLKGYYYEIFDEIYTWGEVRFGTTGVSFGTGTWYITMPFNIKTGIGPFTSASPIAANILLGSAYINDNDTVTNRQPANLLMATDSNGVYSNLASIVTREGNTTREANALTPFTWAINDGFSWSAKFQRAP